MDFGDALKILKANGKVARESWADVCSLSIRGPGVVPGFTARLTVPYIALSHRDGDGPEQWYPAYTDLMATDWTVVR